RFLCHSRAKRRIPDSLLPPFPCAPSKTREPPAPVERAVCASPPSRNSSPHPQSARDGCKVLHPAIRSMVVDEMVQMPSIVSYAKPLQRYIYLCSPNFIPEIKKNYRYQLRFTVTWVPKIISCVVLVQGIYTLYKNEARSTS